MFGRNRNAIGPASTVSVTELVEDGFAIGADAGLAEGTQIATAMGWIPVEEVSSGDMVLTFDGGMQPVTEVRRDHLWSGFGPCPESLWPLFVPEGTIGNRSEIIVLPEQGVLIETEAAADEFGDPFALIPGLALEGLPGVERHEPYGTVEIVQPMFAEDHVIFTDRGALFYCQKEIGFLGCIRNEMSHDRNYHMVSLREARQLIEAVQHGYVSIENTYALGVA